MIDRKPKSPIENPSAFRRLIAAGTIAAAALTLAACDNDSKADGPTSSQPVATSEASPSSTQDITTSPNPTIESSAPTSGTIETGPTATENPDGTFSFSTKEFAGHPEALGTAIFEKGILAWENAGANPTVAEEISTRANSGPSKQRDKLSDEDFVIGVAESQRNTFANSIFAENWQSNPHLRDIVSTIVEVNQATIGKYYQTYLDKDLGPAFAGEEYKIFTDVTDVKVLSNTADSIVLKVTFHQYDNLAKTDTMMQQQYKPIDKTGSATVTAIRVGDKYLVADYEF